jgi:predicted HAD superfamily hydrolase
MSAVSPDRRLQPAVDMIKSGRVKVLSIDVFDTLLWRKVPEPEDAFLMLGRRLKDAGRLAANTSIIQFAELRRFAQTRAREKKQKITGYREITLRDIYAELPAFIFAPGFDAAKALTVELELEASLMVLDGEVAALAVDAAAKGVNVILVSDTYFSSPELSVFLAKAGLSNQKHITRIVASNEAGKPKWRDLFDVLLPQLGIVASDMLHIGDTMDADITPCRRLGIPCLHYDKWGFSPRVKSHEFPPAMPDRAQLLGASGDFGLTGLRSRLAYRAPAALSPDLQFFWSYGASVMAPLFAGFARWIVQSAKDADADAVYGLMREGRFLKRVVDLTAGQLGVATNFQELWLSRRAVIRAGLYADEADLIGEYVLAAPGQSTDEILGHIGLTRADLAAISPDLEKFDAGQADAFVKMISAILMNPALKQKIEAHSASLRPGLLKGLSKVIPFTKSPRIMLVDLGYTATIQAVLQRILTREGLKVDVSG